MSALGMVDAMRSERPPSERLVWQCLENHSNTARWWSISIDEIAVELHLSKRSVCDAIKVLERDRIIRAERKHRRKTVYHMLRVYPPSTPTEQRAGIGEVLGAKSAPKEGGLDADFAPKHPVLGRKICTPSTPVRIQQQTRAQKKAHEGDERLSLHGAQPPSSRPLPPAEPEEINGFMVPFTIDEVCKLTGRDPQRLPRDQRAIVCRWLSDEFEPEHILKTIQRVLGRREDLGEGIASLKFFDRAVREQRFSSRRAA